MYNFKPSCRKAEINSKYLTQNIKIITLSSLCAAKSEKYKGNLFCKPHNTELESVSLSLLDKFALFSNKM